jgi:hypothetical protein
MNLWAIAQQDQTVLLRTAIPTAESLSESTVLLIVDLSSPYKSLKEVETWASAVRVHADELLSGNAELREKLHAGAQQRWLQHGTVDSSQDVALQQRNDEPMDIPDASMAESDDKTMTGLSLEEGVMIDFVGAATTVIVGVNSETYSDDMASQNEKEQDFVQYQLRRLAMRLGAGVVYVSSKSGSNINVLNDYLLHLRHPRQFPLVHKPQVSTVCILAYSVCFVLLSIPMYKLAFLPSFADVLLLGWQAYQKMFQCLSALRLQTCGSRCRSVEAFVRCSATIPYVLVSHSLFEFLSLSQIVHRDKLFIPCGWDRAGLIDSLLTENVRRYVLQVCACLSMCCMCWLASRVLLYFLLECQRYFVHSHCNFLIRPECVSIVHVCTWNYAPCSLTPEQFFAQGDVNATGADKSNNVTTFPTPMDVSTLVLSFSLLIQVCTKQWSQHLLLCLICMSRTTSQLNTNK